MALAYHLATMGQSQDTIRYDGNGVSGTVYRFADPGMTALQYAGLMGSYAGSSPTYTANRWQDFAFSVGAGISSPVGLDVGNQATNILTQFRYDHQYLLGYSGTVQWWAGASANVVIHTKLNTSITNTFSFWDIFSTVGPTGSFRHTFQLFKKFMDLESSLTLPLVGIGFSHNFTGLYDIAKGEFAKEILGNPSFAHWGNFFQAKWSTFLAIPTKEGDRIRVGYIWDAFQTRYGLFTATYGSHSITLLFDGLR